PAPVAEAPAAPAPAAEPAPASAPAGGATGTDVVLPALGESVTEGTVTRWLKQVGESVEADEPLLEVSTDKVDTEIPSPASGVLLEIRAQEDETVEVGAVLAVIGEPSEADGSPAAEAPTEQAQAEESQEAQAEEEPEAKAEEPPEAQAEETPEAQAEETPEAQAEETP